MGVPVPEGGTHGTPVTGPSQTDPHAAQAPSDPALFRHAETPRVRGSLGEGRMLVPRSAPLGPRARVLVITRFGTSLAPFGFGRVGGQLALERRYGHQPAGRCSVSEHHHAFGRQRMKRGSCPTGLGVGHGQGPSSSGSLHGRKLPSLLGSGSPIQGTWSVFRDPVD